MRPYELHGKQLIPCNKCQKGVETTFPKRCNTRTRGDGTGGRGMNVRSNKVKMRCIGVVVSCQPTTAGEREGWGLL